MLAERFSNKKIKLNQKYALKFRHAISVPSELFVVELKKEFISPIKLCKFGAGSVLMTSLNGSKGIIPSATVTISGRICPITTSSKNVHLN